MNMTESWQQCTLSIEHDWISNRQTLTLPPCPMFFSCRGAKQGWPGVPASASLQAGAGGHVQADCTSMFFWVKFMFVVAVFFGHLQLLRFVVVKNFRSCSNPWFGHIYLVMWISLIKTSSKMVEFSLKL